MKKDKKIASKNIKKIASFSIEPTLKELVEDEAARQNRSFSNYVCMVLKEKVAR